MSSTRKQKSQRKVSDCSITLTRRQLEVVRLIRSYRNSNGCSPTLQEMAKLLGVSKVTVFEHVEALVRRGLLHRQANRARSLSIDADLLEFVEQSDEAGEFTEADGAVRGFVWAGEIAAGIPIEAIEQTERLDLNELFPGEAGVFILRVRGDSMIDRHICNGDYVLADSRISPRDGQIVVALLDNGEATLKELYRCEGGFRLQSANSLYPPIHVDRLNIQGVVIGVVRNCHGPQTSL